MLTLISPAKTLNYESSPSLKDYTLPVFLSESEILVKQCQSLSIKDLEKLMKISNTLAKLNKTRFDNWCRPFNLNNAKQAILAFRGDVYEGLHVDDFSLNDFYFAQDNLIILSGLYGVLRPLDLIQPYRLEMGAPLGNKRGTNLYQFWKKQITDLVKEKLALNSPSVLINLASDEYFKAIHLPSLHIPVIKPIFLDEKNGQYKVISFYAKKARGLLSRFIIKNRLASPASLQQFNALGYQFDKIRSSKTEFIFKRNQKATKLTK